MDRTRHLAEESGAVRSIAVRPHSSEFRREARTSGVAITDAYENGHGIAMSRLGGLLTLKKASRGPALDRGEVQHYLSSLMLCPAALVNHASLEWTAVAKSVLRVGDLADPTGAGVDFGIGIDGEPTACHTIRPRLVGRNAVDTEWVGKARDFRLWNGMRMAHRLDVSWEVPGAPFCYYPERSDAMRTGSLICVSVKRFRQTKIDLLSVAESARI